MITSQELNINQKEDLSVPDFPLREALSSLPSSGQPFKGVEKSQLSQANAQTRSTDASSSSSFNEKTQELLPMQNKEQYDVFQASRVSDESESMSSTFFKWVIVSEKPLVSRKKGRQAGKKKEIKVQKSSAKSKKGPQSPYKNSYKSIFRETVNNIEVFCQISEGHYAKICKEEAKSEEKWDEETGTRVVLMEAMGHELAESPDYFIEWLGDNETDLVTAIGDKKFVKFMSLKDLIRESSGLINGKDCRAFFEELKGRSLQKLQGEGRILTWLLILTFSLAWLPEEPTSKLLPLQKDTVALLHWIISSRAKAKSKHMLLDGEHRSHIRNFLETTFLALFKSAWLQFSDRHNWLTKIGAIAQIDLLIEKHALFENSNTQLTTNSTACSESFSPVGDQGHENVDLEESSRKQAAFLEKVNEIIYDKNFLDYNLIQESKLEFSYNEEILTHQNLIPIKDDPYQQEKDFYTRMHAFEGEDDEDWSENGLELDWFNDQHEELHRSAWKLQRDLDGKGLDFLCGGYDDVESRKKVKKM